MYSGPITAKLRTGVDLDLRQHVKPRAQNRVSCIPGPKRRACTYETPACNIDLPWPASPNGFSTSAQIKVLSWCILYYGSFQKGLIRNNIASWPCSLELSNSFPEAGAAAGVVVPA